MKAAVLIMRALDGSFVCEASESVVPLQEMARQIRVAGSHDDVSIDRGTILLTDNGASRVVYRFQCRGNPAEAVAAAKPSKRGK